MAWTVNETPALMKTLFIDSHMHEKIFQGSSSLAILSFQLVFANQPTVCSYSSYHKTSGVESLPCGRENPVLSQRGRTFEPILFQE